MILFSGLDTVSDVDADNVIDSGPLLQYRGGGAPSLFTLGDNGRQPTIDTDLTLTPARPAGDQPLSMFTIPPLPFGGRGAAGSLVTPAVQQWFDDHIVRAGGPVTQGELDTYLLDHEGRNSLRQAGSLTDSERITLMQYAGIPVSSTIGSTVPVASRPVGIVNSGAQFGTLPANPDAQSLSVRASSFAPHISTARLAAFKPETIFSSGPSITMPNGKKLGWLPIALILGALLV